MNNENRTVKSEQENGDGDRFLEIQKTIEELTGYPPNGAKGIEAIKEIEKMGAIDVDIKAGIQWLNENGRTVRYYNTLVNPTRTAMAMRLQQNQNVNRYENAKVYE